MQTQLILGLWWLSMAANAAFLGLRLRRWLFRRYPVFAWWTIYQATLSAIAIAVGGATGHTHPYAEIWRSVQLPNAVFLMLVCVESIFALARHYPGIQGFARGALLPLAFLSVSLSLWIGTLDRPWPWTLWRYLVFGQHVDFTLFLILAVALWFFGRHLGRALRRNALFHGLILSVLLAALFGSNLTVQISGGGWRFFGNILIVAAQFATYACWTVALKPAGEIVPFAPRPTMSGEEFERLEALDQEYLSELGRVSSGAVRRAFRAKEI